jgi:hypothetical protein
MAWRCESFLARHFGVFKVWNSVFVCPHDRFQNGPREYTLVDGHERNVSTIKVEARYVPVPVTLEPRETINSTYFVILDRHL